MTSAVETPANATSTSTPTATYKVWKVVQPPGAYAYPVMQDGKTVNRLALFTPEKNRRYAKTVNSMVNDGVLIPIIPEHDTKGVPLTRSEWEKKVLAECVGFVRGARTTKDGALELLHEVTDPTWVPKMGTTVLDCSPGFRDWYRTGDGKKWTDVVAHVALTNNPVDHHKPKFVPAGKAGTDTPGGEGGYATFMSLTPTGPESPQLVPIWEVPFSAALACIQPAGTSHIFKHADGKQRFGSRSLAVNWLRSQYSKQFSINAGGNAIWMAVMRSPIGGVHIQGKFYPGGQFIPNEVIERATPDEKKKIHDAREGYAKNRATKAQSHMQDAESVHDAILRHAGAYGKAEQHPLDKRDTLRRWAALKNEHGDKGALERVVTLAAKEAKALQAMGPDGLNASSGKYYARRLTAYAQMVGFAVNPGSVDDYKRGLKEALAGEGGKRSMREAGSDPSKDVADVTPAEKVPAKEATKESAKEAVKKPQQEVVRSNPFEAGLKQSDLTNKMREEYGKTAKMVYDRLPAAAKERFDKHVESVSFHESPDVLTEKLKEANPKMTEVVGSKKAGGAYSKMRKELMLNGGHRMDGKKYTADQIYAHEYSHAIDGPDKELSSSSEWREAWKAEAKNLSKYATKTPAEGFAEFGRMVYAGELGSEQLRERYPGMMGYFESAGLLPEGIKKTGGELAEYGSPQMSDVFEAPFDTPEHIGDKALAKRGASESLKDYLTGIGAAGAHDTIRDYAKQLHAEEQSQIDQHNAVYDQAIEALTAHHDKKLTQRDIKKFGDHTKVKGFDQVLTEITGSHPGLFQTQYDKGNWHEAGAEDHAETWDNAEKLWDILKSGKKDKADLREFEDKVVQEWHDNGRPMPEGYEPESVSGDDTSFDFGANVKNDAGEGGTPDATKPDDNPFKSTPEEDRAAWEKFAAKARKEGGNTLITPGEGGILPQPSAETRGDGGGAGGRGEAERDTDELFKRKMEAEKRRHEANKAKEAAIAEAIKNPKFDPETGKPLTGGKKSASFDEQYDHTKVPVVSNDEIETGNWDTFHPGLGSELAMRKSAAGMKGINGEEYAIREHSPGKFQMISRKAGKTEREGSTQEWKHGHTESDKEALARVKASPNQPNRDWEKYADQFGIKGKFHHVEIPTEQLAKNLESGHLRRSNSVNADTVKNKVESGDRNPVLITKEPGKGSLVVDGNHSLQAAIQNGDKTVKAIVSEKSPFATPEPQPTPLQIATGNIPKRTTTAPVDPNLGYHEEGGKFYAKDRYGEPVRSEAFDSADEAEERTEEFAAGWATTAMQVATGEKTGSSSSLVDTHRNMDGTHISHHESVAKPILKKLDNGGWHRLEDLHAMQSKKMPTDGKESVNNLLSDMGDHVDKMWDKEGNVYYAKKGEKPKAGLLSKEQADAIEAGGASDAGNDTFMKPTPAGRYSADDIEELAGQSFTNDKGLTVDLVKDEDGTWSVGSKYGLSAQAAADHLNAHKAEVARGLFGTEVTKQDTAKKAEKRLMPGDKVKYTGRGADPDDEVEFRGYHDVNGQKMARVIFRPKNGMPYENSVPADTVAGMKEKLQWTEPAKRKDVGGELPGMRDTFAPGMFGQVANEKQPDDALEPVDDEPAGDNFNPQVAIGIAADSIDKLRGSDVYRVLNSSTDEHYGKIKDYILQKRPDLKSDVEEAHADIKGESGTQEKDDSTENQSSPKHEELASKLKGASRDDAIKLMRDSRVDLWDRSDIVKLGDALGHPVTSQMTPNTAIGVILNGIEKQAKAASKDNLANNRTNAIKSVLEKMDRTGIHKHSTPEQKAEASTSYYGSQMQQDWQKHFSGMKDWKQAVLEHLNESKSEPAQPTPSPMEIATGATSAASNPSTPQTGISGASTNAHYLTYSGSLQDKLAEIIRSNHRGEPIPEGIITPSRIKARYDLGITPEAAAAEIYNDLVKPRLEYKAKHGFEYQDDRNPIKEAKEASQKAIEKLRAQQTEQAAKDIEKSQSGKPVEIAPSVSIPAETHQEVNTGELFKAAEAAETKGGSPSSPSTPREVAAAVKRATDPAYAFARASSVSNAGEDLQYSKRHLANAWRGLEEAEQDGTAEKLVTRDKLLENEPHNLMTHAEKNPLTSMAMHFALKHFPTTPSYKANKYSRATTDPEKLKKNRQQYVEAFRSIKGKAEKLAESETDPKKALSALADHVGSVIRALRGQQGHDSISRATATDIYNEIANALTKMPKQLRDGTSWRTESSMSPMGRINEFTKHLADKHGMPPTAGGTPEEKQAYRERLNSAAKNVIEGQSPAKAFGVSSGKESDKEGKKRISSAEMYVDVASRKGGREVPRLQSGLKDHLLKNIGIRGLQFGNYVSDDERSHHLEKAAEAFVDLADVLGLPDNAISLGGNLGLAFGARGSGGALAHYEPSTKVINLTRKGGVGSLAHEWGHGLDHFLAGGGKAEAKGGSINSGMLSTETSPERFERDASGNWKKDEKGRMVTINKKDDPVWAAMDDVRKSWDNSGFKKRLGSYIRDLVDDGYMSESKANYWRSNSEMFARTFEQWVQHELLEQGRQNTYLAGFDHKEYGDDKVGSKLWPTREESRSMGPAFKKLMTAIREKHFSQKDMSIAGTLSRDERIANMMIALQV